MYLASHLYNNYQDKTIQTFHYDPTIDFHRANLGLDELAYDLVEKVDLESVVIPFTDRDLKDDDLHEFRENLHNYPSLVFAFECALKKIKRTNF